MSMIFQRKHLGLKGPWNDTRKWVISKKEKKNKEKKFFLRRKYTLNTHVTTWEKCLPYVPCQPFNKAMCFGPWSRQEKWGILITVSSKQITNGVLTLWKVPVAFYDDKYNSSSFSAWPLRSADSCNKNTFPGIRKRRGEYKRESILEDLQNAPHPFSPLVSQWAWALPSLVRL